MADIAWALGWASIIVGGLCATSVLAAWAFSRIARNLNHHVAPPSRWDE